MIPRGSGINSVKNDGKIILTRSRKERTLIDLKISPRDCKWTQSSRAFFKKSNKSAKEQNEFIQITKIVRGFTLVPKALVSEVKKPAHQSHDDSRKNEKVNLKSNLRK